MNIQTVNSRKLEPGTVAHTHPNTWEPKGRRLLQSQPGLHSEFLANRT